MGHLPQACSGSHDSHDYARLQEAATKALPYPFALAKHFHAKYAEGEASNKYANLQSKYAGNFAKIKTLKWRMDAWDMISPFVIPEFIDPFALLVEDRWGDRKLTGVNLLKNWGKCCLRGAGLPGKTINVAMLPLPSPGQKEGLRPTAGEETEALRRL